MGVVLVMLMVHDIRQANLFTEISVFRTKQYEIMPPAEVKVLSPLMLSS